MICEASKKGWGAFISNKASLSEVVSMVALGDGGKFRIAKSTEKVSNSFRSLWNDGKNTKYFNI